MFEQRIRAVLCTALFLLALQFISGCIHSPKDHLTGLAQQSLINQPITIYTSKFQLYGWGRNNHTSNLNVYIEGDGQAWEDPWTISKDPSPPDPMAFRLALADINANSIIYLARPCQYVMDKRCSILDWTSDRYGPKIIKAFDEALNEIKQKWHIQTFKLHAYSGGAVIALLLASQRDDIRTVITFAPLLDPVEWVNYHHYTPLSGSLSPLDKQNRLRRVHQHHFIGQNDKIVPLYISNSYFSAIPQSQINHVYIIDEFEHHSDWPEIWKSNILNTK